MRVPRVHTRQALEVDTLVRLEPEVSHHLAHVLRLGAGAPVVLFDGGPAEFEAVIESATRDGVAARVVAARTPVRESPLRIHLGQGISRGERMDYTLQKSVELGVAGIAPLWTARSQVRLDGKRLEKRLEHWRGIVRSACEQSGRLTLPALEDATTLDAWAARLAPGCLRLLLDPDAQRSIRDIARPDAEVAILIGPEGGLDAGEIARARDCGFVGVRLGPRVLRTETAAVVALSAVQTLWGDLG